MTAKPQDRVTIRHDYTEPCSELSPRTHFGTATWLGRRYAYTYGVVQRWATFRPLDHGPLPLYTVAARLQPAVRGHYKDT